MVNDYTGFTLCPAHGGDDVPRVWHRHPFRSGPLPGHIQNRVSAIFDYGEFDVAAHYYDGYEYTATVWTDELVLDQYP